MPIKIKECELSILFFYMGQQRVESVDFLSCPYVKFLGLFYQVIIVYIYFIYSFCAFRSNSSLSRLPKVAHLGKVRFCEIDGAPKIALMQSRILFLLNI